MRTARKRGATRQATEHHQLLGIPQDADLETIKRAYRHLAREVHPDTNPDDPQAADRFQKLTVAYETLAAHAPPSDPDPDPGTRTDDHDGARTTSGAGGSGALRSTDHGPTDGPVEVAMPGPAARPRHNIFAAPAPPGGSDRSGAGRPSVTPDGGPAGTTSPTGSDERHARDGTSHPGGPPPGTPTGHSSTTTVKARELPRPLADALVRCLLLAPALWAVAGLPGLAGRGFAAGPLQIAVGTTLALVGWVLTGALLWSRAPSVPRKLPWWRSPGWDGTALAVRLVLFYALVSGSTAFFLTPHLDDSDSTDAPPSTLGVWVVLTAAAWVISGRLPAHMGYQSRFERYWRLADNGLPRQIFRIRPTDIGRTRSRPEPRR